MRYAATVAVLVKHGASRFPLAPTFARKWTGT